MENEMIVIEAFGWDRPDAIKLLDVINNGLKKSFGSKFPSCISYTYHDKRVWNHQNYSYPFIRIYCSSQNSKVAKTIVRTIKNKIEWNDRLEIHMVSIMQYIPKHVKYGD